ncbi:MAG: hypothetical protein P8188_18095, partial [Gemmatimonadota bacterium]
MKRILKYLAVALLLPLAAPSSAAAQSSVGGLLDWVHKLSGPQFIGPTLSYAVGGQGARFRISGSYRWSFSSEDAIDPDDGSITMLSIEPAG